MKAVIQYVNHAKVEVNSTCIASILEGYLILIGVCSTDTVKNAHLIADKIAKLRVIPDSQGKLNLNLDQGKGEILLVSQFTLCADTTSNRPSFSQAAPKPQAIELLEIVKDRLINIHHLPVKTGEFGAMMNVTLTNVGPITIIFDE